MGILELNVFEKSGLRSSTYKFPCTHLMRFAMDGSTV